MRGRGTEARAAAGEDADDAADPSSLAAGLNTRIRDAGERAVLREKEAADIERIHKIWVDAVRVVGPDIHHRDVVTAALAALEDDLHSERRKDAIEHLRSHITSS